jgi:predicted MFS family arabinose efflux permease
VTVVATSAVQCVILPLLSLAPSSLLLSVLLFGFGALGGIAGVAMNAQALLVQTLGRRSMMSSFHALYSVGGLVGAAFTGLLLKSGLSIELCGAFIATALFVLSVTQYPFLLPKGDEAGPSTSSIKVPPASILLVGMMTFSFFLAEGAVLDWGAVFLRFFRGYDPADAGFGYAAFSVAMATGRLLGDRIVNRLGAVRVVGGGAVLGALGFLVLVYGPGSASGLVGCALIGIGASNVVPTLISASARISDMPAGAAVSTVVAMGYCGLIAGPAIIGYIAQATSVPIALATMAALLLVVGAGARVVRERD